jgi:hypothetical protein
MRDWIIVGVLYVAGMGLLGLLGGLGAAGEALRDWGRSVAAPGRARRSSASD